MKTDAGPVSDHFDGARFFDPDGVPPRSLREVLRWQFGPGRQRQAWPVWSPSPHADTPPARVDGEKARLSFVGHASWLIQAAGLNILIDPMWSARASPVSWAGPKRRNDPGIAFDALPPIDAALVSHGHYDHLDLATLSKLAAKFSPRVITPLGSDAIMRGAEAFDWHDRVELGNGIAVTLVPTRHWSARGLFDRNRALWASFVMETPAGKIYIVCDSGYGEGIHFRRVAEAHGPLRLAILPIGAYEPRWFMRDQHMNPSDAVKALADCGAAQALRIITVPFSSPMKPSARRSPRCMQHLMKQKFRASVLWRCSLGRWWRFNLVVPAFAGTTHHCADLIAQDTLTVT